MCWGINESFRISSFQEVCPPPHVACMQTAGSVILRVCLEIQRCHWGHPRVSCSRRTAVLLHHQMEGFRPWTGIWSHKRNFNTSTAKQTKPFDCDSPKITLMSEFSSFIATKRHIWPGVQDSEQSSMKWWTDAKLWCIWSSWAKWLTCCANRANYNQSLPNNEAMIAAVLVQQSAS